MIKNSNNFIKENVQKSNSVSLTNINEDLINKKNYNKRNSCINESKKNLSLYVIFF